MNRFALFNSVKVMARRPRLSTVDFDVFVTLVEAELNTALLFHPKNEVTSTLTIDEETGYLPLPFDLVQLIRLKKGDQVYREYIISGIAQPKYTYISHGNCLETLPAPAIDDVFTLHFTTRLTPLTADISSNWVSQDYPHLYLYGILKELGTSISHPKTDYWEKRFYNILDQVNLQGWNQNMAAAPKVVE